MGRSSRKKSRRPQISDSESEHDEQPQEETTPYKRVTRRRTQVTYAESDISEPESGSKRKGGRTSSSMVLSDSSDEIDTRPKKSRGKRNKKELPRSNTASTTKSKRQNPSRASSRKRVGVVDDSESESDGFGTDEDWKKQDIEMQEESEIEKSDANEDECNICHTGGELFCCDACPRSFHLKCLKPKDKPSPTGLWYCATCRDEGNRLCRNCKKCYQPEEFKVECYHCKMAIHERCSGIPREFLIENPLTFLIKHIHGLNAVANAEKEEASKTESGDSKSPKEETSNGEEGQKKEVEENKDSDANTEENKPAEGTTDPADEEKMETSNAPVAEENVEMAEDEEPMEISTAAPEKDSSSDNNNNDIVTSESKVEKQSNEAEVKTNHHLHGHDVSDYLKTVHYMCYRCQDKYTLDVILDSALPSTEKTPRNLVEYNSYYFCKFKDCPYLWTLWLPYQRVQQLSRMKLRNFLSRAETGYEDDDGLDVGDDDEIDDEGIYESYHGVLLNWLKVEKVLDTRDQASPEGISYPKVLCKWHGREYKDATWEDRVLIAELFPKFLKEHLDRVKMENDLKANNKLYQSMVKERPESLRRFEKFTEQPAYMSVSGGKLHDYQLEGMNWLCHSWNENTSVILADEMGLGKTVQAISLLAYLFNDAKLTRPHLVIAPLSTLSNWARELSFWAPYMNAVLYTGNGKSREIIRQNEFYYTKVKRHSRLTKFEVLLTSYELLLTDQEYLRRIKWRSLIVDEGHRLKNQDSKLLNKLIDFQTELRVLLTGTPLQNKIEELLTMLRFLSPDKFSKEYTEELATEFNDKIMGREEEEEEEEAEEGESSGQQQKQKIVDSLHLQLRPHMLRRMKKDISLKIPSKTELIIRVDLSKKQKELYKGILSRNYNVLQALDKKNKSKVSCRSLINVLTNLRLVADHPLLVESFTEEQLKNQGEMTMKDLENLVIESGKLQLLDRMLVKFKRLGNRLIVFSQFVIMLNILEQYLTMRGYKHLRLDGSTPHSERQIIIDKYNRENSDYFVIIMSTKAGGLGINLATADTVVLFDSDFNPHNDLQALNRAHRIGQTRKVMIYRMITRFTVEEKVMEIAKQKLMLEHIIVRQMGGNKGGEHKLKQGELNNIIKFGTSKLFCDESEEDSLVYTEDVLDKLLDRELQSRAKEKEVVEQEKEADKEGIDDYLSAFKVAHFETSKTTEEEDKKENYWGSLLQIERMLAQQLQAEHDKYGKGKRVRKKIQYSENNQNVSFDSDSPYAGESNASSSSTDEEGGADEIEQEAADLTEKRKRRGMANRNDRKRPEKQITSAAEMSSCLCNRHAYLKKLVNQIEKGDVGSSRREDMLKVGADLLEKVNQSSTSTSASQIGLSNFPMGIYPTGSGGNGFNGSTATGGHYPQGMGPQGMFDIREEFNTQEKRAFINGILLHGVFNHDWKALFNKCAKLSHKTLNQFLDHVRLFIKALQDPMQSNQEIFCGLDSVLIQNRLVQLVALKKKMLTLQQENVKELIIQVTDYHDSIKELNEISLWTPKEDLMLLQSIEKHGYGEWNKIVDDKTIWSDGASEEKPAFKYLFYLIDKKELENEGDFDLAKKYVADFVNARALFVSQCIFKEQEHMGA
eukprot:CAMPEP_0115046674 /NCGR_PEP_ID=MMETSP0216-20121206/48875_1 /TAXON_ID=223996 /ORGANISM="Protocruzia adherens, Strain Boccale" /LENGTH=1611 /DNA_ID=CAMNT_0002429771 /DNA_START=24 /DNA_END=4859 /DNA_ORIENTATION=-